MAEARIVVGYVAPPAGSDAKTLVRVAVREVREDAHIKTTRLNLTVEKARELVAELQALLREAADVLAVVKLDADHLDQQARASVVGVAALVLIEACHVQARGIGTEVGRVHLDGRGDSPRQRRGGCGGR